MGVGGGGVASLGAPDKYVQQLATPHWEVLMSVQRLATVGGGLTGVRGIMSLFSNGKNIVGIGNFHPFIFSSPSAPSPLLLLTVVLVHHRVWPVQAGRTD